MRALIALLYCFFLLSSAGAETSPVLRVGGILTLTGEGAPYGINGQRGIMLAVEEINAGGGVAGKRLEVVWEDETGGKAEPAVTAFRKLVTLDSVRFIFGPCYQDAIMALQPLAVREKILLLTPSSPRLSLPAVFSTWIDPAQEARLIAEVVLRRHRRIAILSSEQSWDAMVSRAFREEVLRRGGKIVSFQEANPEATSVQAEVLRTKSAAPEAVFVGSYTLFTKFVPALKKIGVRVALYGIEVDRAVIDGAGGAAEGLVFVGPAVPESSFSQTYQQRYGMLPDIPAYQGYDLVKLFVRAIAAVGEEPQAVAGWLDNFGEHQGAAGTYYASRGKLTFSAGLFLVQGKNYTPWSGGE